MRLDGKQLGYPHFLYTNGKAAIEALSGLVDGAVAYATDTYEFGSYGNSAWLWGQGSKLNQIDDSGTYRSFVQFAQATMSSGLISGGVITDNGDGTIDISAGEGYLRESSSFTSELKTFTFSAVEDMEPTVDTLNYIYADYNFGSPTLDFTTALSDIDHASQFVVGLVFPESDHAHISSAGQRLDNFVHDVYHYMLEVRGKERASGLVLTEDATEALAINVSSGVLYWALDRIEVDSVDTSTDGDNDNITLFYRDGLDGWTENNVHSLNTDYYDDGSGTLDDLTVNKYGVFWAYMTIDGYLYVQYGQTDGSLAEAEAASIPETMPEITAAAIFIGKIIIQEGESEFLEILAPWVYDLGVEPATSHSSLSDLGTGSDHSYIDQDVTSGASPVFDGSNFTGISVDPDYSDISGNDAGTDISAAELEELSDGSETTLHSHAGGGGDVVDDLAPQLGGDLDLNGHGIDFPTTPNITDVLDEDSMVSDSATKLATQQSIKKYIDDGLAALFYNNVITWAQEFDEELTDFDVVTPAWDAEVDEVADFDSETDADGDLNDAAGLGHDGGNALEIEFDDNNPAYGVMNASAVNQTSGVFSFWLNKNTIAIDAGKSVALIQARDGAGLNSWMLYLGNTAGTYYLRMAYYTDAPAFAYAGAAQTLTAGYHNIKIMSAQASGAGNNDGWMRLYIDDVLVVNNTGHDNDTKDWDYARFGVITTSSTTFAGSFYLDTIKIDPVGGPMLDTLAVQNGTYGISIPVMDTTARYVSFTDPTAETAVTIETGFDPNVLTMADNDEWVFMDSTAFYARLLKSGTSYKVSAVVQTDTGTTETADYTITDAYHTFRIVGQVSSGVGADDGYLKLYSDDVLLETLSGVDNDTRSVGTISFGACSGLDAGTYGIFYMDDCKWSSDVFKK